MKLRKGIFCLLLLSRLFQLVTAYATAGGLAVALPGVAQ